MAATLETTAERSAKRMRYSQEERVRALTVLALQAGNVMAAVEMLELQGLSIPRETLRDWARKSEVELYARIRSEVAPQLQEKVAAETEDFVFEQAKMSRKLLTRLDETYEDLKPKEVATALKDNEVAKAVNIDKLLALRGQATQIVEHRHSIEEDLRYLAQHGVIEGTAREKHPATQLPSRAATAPEVAEQTAGLSG